VSYDLHLKIAAQIWPSDDQTSDRPAKSPTTDQFNEILPDKNTEFNNPKLDTLWKSAAQSGFSESELETLKVELNHHQEKVDELNVLLDDVDVRLLSNKILQG
jgi:hypothetical protein